MRRLLSRSEANLDILERLEVRAACILRAEENRRVFRMRLDGQKDRHFGDLFRKTFARSAQATDRGARRPRTRVDVSVHYRLPAAPAAPYRPGEVDQGATSWACGIIGEADFERMLSGDMPDAAVAPGEKEQPADGFPICRNKPSSEKNGGPSGQNNVEASAPCSGKICINLLQN